MKHLSLILFIALTIIGCNNKEESITPKEDAINTIDISPDAPVLKDNNPIQMTYPNNLPRITGRLNKNNKRHGLWFGYYDNGYEEWMHDYSNGILHGEFRTYHNNGEKQVVGKYIQGKKTGIWISYDREGNEENRDTIK
jgi:hypothetical protein